MRFSAVISVLLLSGCAGAGVLATSDPLKKLNTAEHLLHVERRPLIAERLIREAIAIYQERGDFHGLGHAYRDYADLLDSPTVTDRWADHYQRNGFLDKTVTYANRSEKAFDYYSKANDNYAKAIEAHRNAGRYDLLTNAFINIGFNYTKLNDRASACRSFDDALGAYDENIRRNPGVTPYSPVGTVADRIIHYKTRAGCA